MFDNPVLENNLIFCTDEKQTHTYKLRLHERCCDTVRLCLTINDTQRTKSKHHLMRKRCRKATKHGQLYVNELTGAVAQLESICTGDTPFD